MRQVNELIPIKHPRLKIGLLVIIGLLLAYVISSFVTIYGDKSAYTVALKQFNNVNENDRYYFGEKKVVYQYEQVYITYDYQLNDGVVVMKNTDEERALIVLNDYTLFDFSKNTYYVWTY